MKRICLLVVALAALVIFVSSTTVQADTVVKAPFGRAIVRVGDAPVVAAPVGYRYARPYWVAPRVRVATPAVTVEVAKPAYSIVEQPATPRIIQGLFRDRVVLPRRGTVSIVPQQ